MKPIRYICSICGNTNSITSFWKWFWTPHFGNKKWLKCKHCNTKRHFMNRMDCKWSMIDWPIEKKPGRSERKVDNQVMEYECPVCHQEAVTFVLHEEKTSALIRVYCPECGFSDEIIIKN